MNDRNLPPLAPSRPWVGGTWDILTRPLEFVADSAARVGPIFRVVGPGVQMTVVCGKACHELALEDDGVRLHRQGLFQAFATETGVDLFAAMGEQHQKLRKLLKLPYSRQVTAQFVGDMTELVVQQIQGYRRGERLRLADETARLSMLCMMATVTPMDLADLVPEFSRYSEAVMWVVTGQRPPLVLRDPRYVRAKARSQAAVREAIDRHRRGMYADDPRMFMIDACLCAGDGGLSDDAAAGTCIYAIGGAPAYMGRIAGFMLYELYRNDALRARVLDEVDAAFASPDGLSAENLRRMSITRAAYLETLRRYPLIPGLPFKAAKSFQVNGYDIPEGELVLLCPAEAHYSPEHYVCPGQFDAYRCMRPRSEYLADGAFAPFGAGARTCAAGGMVEISSLALVAAMLRHADIEIEQRTYQLDLVMAPLISPKDGVPVVYRGPRDLASVKPRTDVLSVQESVISLTEKEQDLRELPAGTLLSCEPGDAIVTQGDAAEHFFILVGGAVAVEKTDAAGRMKVVGELGPGQSFGELGLIKRVPRAATVRATSRAHVVRLDRDTFSSLIADIDLTSAEIGTFLRHRYMTAVLGSALPRLDAGAFVREGSGVEIVHVPKGDIVIRQGDRAEDFFVIAAGEVEVIAALGEPEARSLAALGPGRYFGETGLMKRQPREATVRAISDAVLVKIGRERFDAMLRSSAETREDVAMIVCRRLLETFTTQGVA